MAIDEKVFAHEASTCDTLMAIMRDSIIQLKNKILMLN